EANLRGPFASAATPITGRLTRVISHYCYGHRMRRGGLPKMRALRIIWRVQDCLEGECIMSIAATAKESLAGAGWFNSLLGMWLAVSPFVLGFERSTAAMWSNIALGAAVVLITWVSGAGERPIQWLAVPVALWLFLSPFVLGFPNSALLANNIILAF